MACSNLISTNLIIKAGEKLPSLDSVAGDYEDWMAEILGWGRDDYRSVAVYLGEKLPSLDAVKSIIITGAGAMVTDDFPWITESAEWLARAAESQHPILGICFGHQLLAHALGGTVGDNPHGLEVGTIPVHLTREASDDSLFRHMPVQFAANVSHMQSVIKLPDGARLLAYSKREPVHAFSYGELIWGIQFHPEFDAKIVKQYIHYFDAQLKQEGRNMAALLKNAGNTLESRQLLQGFAKIHASC